MAKRSSNQLVMLATLEFSQVLAKKKKTDPSTGVKPGGFSVSINTRFWQDSIWEMWKEVVEALKVHNASMASHLLRDTMETKVRRLDQQQSNPDHRLLGMMQ